MDVVAAAGAILVIFVVVEKLLNYLPAKGKSFWKGKVSRSYPFYFMSVVVIKVK